MTMTVDQMKEQATPYAVYANFVMPAHAASFHLTHNEHKGYYETVEELFASQPDRFTVEDFVSAEDRQKCIDDNELWQVQWYPNSPVGFNSIHGSSYEVVMSYLWEKENQRMMLVAGEQAEMMQPAPESEIDQSNVIPLDPNIFYELTCKVKPTNEATSERAIGSILVSVFGDRSTVSALSLKPVVLDEVQPV